MNETGALVEPGLGGKDALVDLAAPARCAGEDPQALQLLVGRPASRRSRAPRPPARRSRASESPRLAEDDRRGVLLELDLAASRRCASASGEREHGVAELGLGQEQEVVLAAAPDDERRDHARLSASAAAPRRSRPASTSFETMRCRRSPASGPVHPHVGPRADVGLRTDATSRN